MRLLLILVAALAIPSGLAASESQLANRDCQLKSRHAKPETKAERKRLGELPPGQLILTVFRRDENNCPIPLVVREGIGAWPSK